jgi:hypothetical protein
VAYIKIGADSYYSEETYKKYLEAEEKVLNIRLRDKDETFIDALLSDEADYTADENGNEIVETLKNLEW